MAIPATIREPRADIEAQIAAVANPRSPKATAFIASGSPLVDVPEGLFVGRRSEGTLISRDSSTAEWFSSAPDVTPSDMAGVLGYPEPNDAVEASGSAVAVQALDENGNVVMESASTIPMAKRTSEMYQHFGTVVILPMAVALARRRERVLQEDATCR
jgi:hypothetical protein